MISKTFIGSILPTLKYNDGVYYLGPDKDIFGPQYEIIYSKWDEIVKSQQ